eukprot:753053-Hanusia_phi.AAC.6
MGWGALWLCPVVEVGWGGRELGFQTRRGPAAPVWSWGARESLEKDPGVGGARIFCHTAVDSTLP